MEKALDSLPTTLGAAYQAIMSRMETKGTKEFALRALSWLLNAKRSLHMVELRELLLVEVGDKEIKWKYLSTPDFVLDACESLISYDQITGIVRLAHQTVRDFLRTEYKDFLPSISTLAMICLTYLSFDAFDDPDHKVTTEQFQTLQEKYKALSYVARYLYVHVSASEESIDVQKGVFTFLMSEKKRNSLRHIKNMDSDMKNSLLHILAEFGLTSICRIVLDPAKRCDCNYLRC